MKVFNYGPDWYTATNVLQDNQQCVSLFQVFQEVSKGQMKWRAGGYKGHECLVTGVKYGSRIRKDGRADEMLVASGPISREVIEKIGDPSRYRATRFDLQITLHLDPAERMLASNLYDRLRTRQNLGTSPLGNRKIALIRSGTGDTLYLGIRSSSRKFFRLYDKSLDLGYKPGQFWRAEVQYGRDLAEGALRWYTEVGGVEHCIVDLVCSEFFDAMEWSPFKKYQYNRQHFPPEQEDLPTLDRKLAWLETCVKPTVALLIENGLERETRDALGLPVRGAWARRQLHRGRALE